MQKAGDRGITRVSLWPSGVSGLHPAPACISLNRSGMLGQPGCLPLFFLTLSHLFFAGSPFSAPPLYPSISLSSPFPLHLGENALRSTQSLWNSFWETVGDVCNLIRQARKSQAVAHNPSLLGSKCFLRNPVWGLMRPCWQFGNNAPCNNMEDCCLKT